MSQHAIELKRLCRYFGKKPVVDDLSLNVQTGKVTALLGLNGAGKTTTIRILMGLLSPTRGAALTLGVNATTMSEATRKRIGYLVEGHFLYPSMRVRQCQSFQREGYDSWNGQLFDDIVRHFAIDPAAKVATLSRGQRAGVALAMVLAPDPELLVLDDPALGLDPVSRRIADRVAVMVGGRLKVDTSMDDFVSRVSLYSVKSDGREDQAAVSAIPGLIEARRVGNRMQMAIADANGVAHAAIEKTFGQPEQIETTLNDAVLAFLTRQRGDRSFFSSSISATADKSFSEASP